MMTAKRIPLHDLVSLGQIGEVRELLSKDKSSVNVQNKENGNYAIIIAAERNDAELVKLLITSGAKADVNNFYGTTPLSAAEEMENNEMINLIKVTIKKANENIKQLPQESENKNAEQRRFRC